MATIAYDGDKVMLGKDFVNAVTGDPNGYRCKGKLETRNCKRVWISTFDITTTVNIFRAAVESEGNRIVYFESQSL